MANAKKESAIESAEAESTLSSTIQDTTSSIRDASDRFAGSASEMASSFYGQASSFVSENRSAFIMAGSLIGVGVVGFFLGRSIGRSSSKELKSF